MFELAIGIILGVTLFVIIQTLFKGTFNIDLENFEYENQNQVRGGLGHTSENSVG